ncbi:ceramidase domain-containing protein [Rhodovulum euryhalinum]|uniref:Ceramidase n=1 Tax=Rhodovulum euryhalinum TaxID=35805 RepID=A0A4R2K949_9RHOB|nr:ceramidase domain-containing protein [Rhodovulum euryhalinum]TCO69911.1 ceramidase [Rhodovulum euryhalinum]
MDWMTQVDAYCERTDLSYWSEPVNAVTNAAFVIAAAVMWRRTAGLPLGRALCAVLAAIGLGSYLFHTHATAWASVADVAPILGFILLYLYAANRTFWGLGRRAALAGVALFFPYAAATGWLFGQLPWLGASAGYAPVALLILVHAGLLARRAPATARGLALGGGLLVLSLGFRTLDGPLCGVLPLGTHFLWHLLNATMLGWMIEVYRRDMAARVGQTPHPAGG